MWLEPSSGHNIDVPTDRLLKGKRKVKEDGSRVPGPAQKKQGHVKNGQPLPHGITSGGKAVHMNRKDTK